ncbi:MAG: hypothetical protein GF364_18195 [Candidatus Lokiarchaeota archaeon]|nr:hypothetical protein [Candidatus Lokiarchaeota archaeon]
MKVSVDQTKILHSSALKSVNLEVEGLPRVFKVEGDFFSDHTYIFETPSGFQILSKPWLVGGSLAEAARQCSSEFLRIAFLLCPEFQTTTYHQITEVIPLAGALYYQIGQAFQILFHESLKQCFIGAKRVIDEGSNEWITQLSYLNFEALPDNPVILIGDTIATGGTIERIIRTTNNYAQNPRAIILLSLAGSGIGAYKLSKLEDEFGFPIYLFFSNALFGVAENGTDMPWAHPATLTSKKNSESILKIYGPQLARDWCSIWDWGERAKDPQKHLRLLLNTTNAQLENESYRESFPILKHIKKNTLKAQQKREKKLKIN